MFTHARIYGGDTYLKNHLSANDYYAEGEKVVGYWIGLGAIGLKLSGEVQPHQFDALKNNQMPGTDQRLTPRTKETRQPTQREAKDAFRRKYGRDGSTAEIANFRLSMKPLSNRVAFYDYQCSAQKSVSIMAVLGGDQRLREAHERAARKGFEELERFACRQKNTLLRRDWEMTGNLCAAAFTHDSSRALDPQLHTHFVIANATQDSCGRWYALEEYHMYKAARYAGKAYQNELAREVKALGYDIREVRDETGSVTGFEIDGLPQEICERFAKRREEIECEIERFEAKHGREPSPAEIARIARETRDPKLTEISTPEVRLKQREQLLPGEWERLQSIKNRALQKSPGEIRIAGDEVHALRASVDHLFERQSVLQAWEILAEALNQHLGSICLDTLKQYFANGGAGVVRLTPEQELLAECATTRGLELERWSVGFVNATKNQCVPLNAEFEPNAALSKEQRAAVRAILSTRDQIFSFRGVAGSGKTTTLGEVHRGLAGKRVHYIAPTASAATVLQAEGFKNATTVEDFLQNVTKRESLRGAVVICDEAGLQSNRQGAKLLHLAQQNQMRVLFVGDVRQHIPVEAGDFLRVLEAHSQIGRCEVADIRRQQIAPYKAAIMRMASGDVRGGLNALDELGWMQEGGADYLRHAADDYFRLTNGGAELDLCLLVAPTWGENFRLTDAIRAMLKAKQRLPAAGSEFTVHDSLRWTLQQKRNPRNYAPGQVVTFTLRSGRWSAGESAEIARVERGQVFVTVRDGTEHRLDLRQANQFDVGKPRNIEVVPGDKLLIRANNKRLGLVNGHVLTVDQIEPDQTITTREGVRIPASFNQWCHGYVVTSHKSQGRTCEHVIVAAEKLDAKAAYVACSRGKRSCTVHTPDKQRLLERLPEGNRRAALDALAESQPRRSASILRRAEMWTRLFGQIVANKAAVTRDAVRRRLEQTRQIVQRWTKWQKMLRQRYALGALTRRSVRPGRASTQHL